MNLDTDSWDNEGGQLGTAEGGHLSSSSGRVLRVPGAELAYTVILTRPNLVDLCQSFRTMREAEAFVRRNTPVPASALSTLYDRAAGET
jgi:hypothetical protein